MQVTATLPGRVARLSTVSVPTFAARLLASLMFTFSAFAAWSQTNLGLSLPREPSPAASVSQTIGISTISVKYSRPAVRGRQIWGALVPYGWNVQGFGLGNSAPWRAGANENTVLHLSDPATIEGHQVPAGNYGRSEER